MKFNHVLTALAFPSKNCIESFCNVYSDKMFWFFTFTAPIVWFSILKGKKNRSSKILKTKRASEINMRESTGFSLTLDIIIFVINAQLFQFV